MMRFYTDGSLLRDEHGRHRIFHGINLVEKGNRSTGEPGSFIDEGFRGTWTQADVADFASRGFSLIRLGLMWAALEPRPGEYDEEYLDWISSQIDLFDAHGMAVLLDAHQDLYSQAYGDGAPAWATLSKETFDATELWSDAYLMSTALHESLDAFWANTPGPGGVGLQDRFAAMWAHVSHRVGNHPAVLGYDLLNEPAPGSAAPETFGAVIGAFAQVTGQDPEQVAADFMDPEAKFAQLGKLEKGEVHRQVGDAVAPLVAAFETDVVAPFMDKVTAAVRAAGGKGIVAREHSYFANIGVPSGQPPLDDDQWVYSPHGYDLTVDTEAIALSSNTRAGTIFARHKETQDRLGVPVIAGEWGALDSAEGVSNHAHFLQDTFDSYRWSWTYWCWYPGFSDTEAATALTRPRPLAFAGVGEQWAVQGETFTAQWQGSAGEAPSLFFLPSGTVTVTRDGESTSYTRNGSWVEVPAGDGIYQLKLN